MKMNTVVVCIMLLHLSFINCREDELEVENNLTDKNYEYSLFTCAAQDFCSPWYYCNKGHCKCGRELSSILRCNEDVLSVHVLDRYCMTYNEIHNVMEVGHCIYNFENIDDASNRVYHFINTNISMLDSLVCGKIFNRIGTLCGRCKEDYYPMAYSYNMTCISCHGGSNWWQFVLAAFLPLTIFCFLVLIFKLNAASSHLHGFILYSQAVSIPAIARNILLTSQDRPTYMKIARFVLAVNGIWNLDFFRSLNLNICLRINTLQNLALDFAVGVYPLFLMMLSYFLINLYGCKFKPLVIMWKPFQTLLSLFRKNWEIKTSVVDAFATFFFLSNVKFLSVSFDLLVPVKVHELQPTGIINTSYKLYYDASIELFSSAHLPFAIFGMMILVTLVLLPLLLLILYPFRWFQKLLNLFPFRWYILHTFMDSFYACYKNGTEPGSRDCRWFASLFFVVRLLLLVIGAVTQSTMYFIASSVLLAIFAMILILVEPYKTSHKHYSSITTIFVLLIAMLHMCLTALEYAERRNNEITYMFYLLPAIISILAFLYLPAVVIRQLGCARMVSKRLQAKRLGYSILS